MYHKFAESRIATGPLADRISKEDEDTAFEIKYEEYRSVKLSQGYLEYIDNDPVRISIH
jgi:hypothetical protein